jgi:hypothetical protein
MIAILLKEIVIVSLYNLHIMFLYFCIVDFFKQMK